MLKIFFRPHAKRGGINTSTVYTSELSPEPREYCRPSPAVDLIRIKLLLSSLLILLFATRTLYHTYYILYNVYYKRLRSRTRARSTGLEQLVIIILMDKYTRNDLLISIIVVISIIITYIYIGTGYYYFRADEETLWPDIRK